LAIEYANLAYFQPTATGRAGQLRMPVTLPKIAKILRKFSIVARVSPGVAKYVM
jgi:hypothetical protein